MKLMADAASISIAMALGSLRQGDRYDGVAAPEKKITF
jgi:hypothetical protein